MRRILLGLGAAVFLSACGDPLSGVARFGDLAIADGTGPDIRSLFGVRLAPGEALSQRSGPDSADVPAGTDMPLGEIARVCDVPSNARGTQIQKRASFSLYDSYPNSTAARPFYITGFTDNCARTFTGAVVVTGDVETHEFVRYRPSNESIAFSAVDTAYEALKARECGSGRGVPCGERAARLNRNTQFITVYDFFGGTMNSVPTRWAQILVHDGEVLAVSIKEGG